MEKVYLICYSTEEGTYTSHIAFATRYLAETKCIELMEEDGLDWYVVGAPFVMEQKHEVCMKNRSYYESIYENRMDEIYRELKEEGDIKDIDYACTMEFDETANTEEVVGYYLVNEGTNALKQWLENIEGINLTEQDKEVTRLLKELDKNNYK